MWTRKSASRSAWPELCREKGGRPIIDTLAKHLDEEEANELNWIADESTKLLQ